MPPVAAGEEKEKEVRAPRTPARAHRPPDGVCAPGTPCQVVARGLHADEV